jgi:nitrogen fixation/metabolism regulation signal transduction histidine kinase
MSLVLRITLILVVLTSASLLIILSVSTAHTSQFDDEYAWLVIANVVVTALMALVTLIIMKGAWRRYKKAVFGSKLMVRLSIAFAVIGIVPVALVFVVSNQFLARTIDTWFSKSVDVALDSGYALGRATLDAIKTEVDSQTREVAFNLGNVPKSELPEILDAMTNNNSQAEITVLNELGDILAVKGLGKELVPDLPTQVMLDRLNAAGSVVQIESPSNDPQNSLQVRALAHSNSFRSGDEGLIVQWIEPIPKRLVKDLEALNKGFNDYEQLLLGKKGISQIYNVTLIFTMLLSVLGALLASVLLSSWLVGPLRSLEKATKAVAIGDFRPLKKDKLNHELNDLLASFNEMMIKLNTAQSVALESTLQLKASSRFFEQVLAHLTTGVIVFDQDSNLEQFNSSAQSILGCDLVNNLEQSIKEITVFADLNFNEIVKQPPQKPQRIDSIREDGSELSLIFTAFLLSDTDFDDKHRVILVFDDVTALLAAQKSQAWADMARGLAHEIKNPLTPIQLSAERLQKKLSGHLNESEENVLFKSTQMIVSQVSALKTMIDEFQNYARLPSAQPIKVLLDEVLSEILPLYSSEIRISFVNLCEKNKALVKVDRDQLVQVVHNLIQNAQDAIGNNSKGEIKIICKLIESNSKNKVRLLVEDNGLGIQEDILPKVFEPYITTKSKGTGLGLAIVKKIVEENEAEITLSNKRDNRGQPIGAVATIDFTNYFLKK